LILLSNGNLASASADKTIVIWNIKNSEILRVLTGHTDEIYTLALLPDFIIASGSLDKTVRLWNVS
jgi:WD40 repeat protein